MYQCTRSVECAELPKVTHFSAWLIAKEFHPELFALARNLSDAYAKKGDPVQVLQSFLGVFAAGAAGSFKTADYDLQQSMVAGPLKSIAAFGEAYILLWVAMLLKRIVVCDEPGRTLEFLRCLPLLVWHRKNFECLHPFVQLEDTQLEDAGDAYRRLHRRCRQVRADLYDVLVDLPAQTLSVNERPRTSGDGRLPPQPGQLPGQGRDERRGQEHGHRGPAQQDRRALQADRAQGGGAAQPGSAGGAAGGEPLLARFLYNVAVSENMLTGPQCGEQSHRFIY